MKSTSLLVCFVMAFVVGYWSNSVCAMPFETEVKLSAANTSPNAWIGQAVWLNGNFAILGSDGNNDSGPNSGAAYLFDVTTGEELFKLTAEDPARGSIFGHAVLVDGTTALIGANGTDDPIIGESTGAAYLFDVTTGEQLFKLTASDAAERDFFGHGIGISGNRAIVGSHADDDNGASSGSAYLFDVTTGEELMKLTASDGEAHDQYGYWTAIDGNRAIVGAKYDDFRSGSAYVYDVTTGDELMKLTASDAAVGDEFGYVVAIKGNTVVVGAWKDNDGGSDAGSVYVFDATTGEQRMKITASDGDAGDYFGYALAISGNTLVVGAYGDNDAGDNSGSLYLYDLTFGDELGKITSSTAAAGDEFGTAVGISGNYIVSGALFDDTDGPNVGLGYAYDISTLLPPGADFNDDGVVDNDDLIIWQTSSPIPRLDINLDDQVNGADLLLWQQHFQPDIQFVENPANLDQTGPVDESDLNVWELAFGDDGLGDVDSDGDSDGADFVTWQLSLTPNLPADANLDWRVDGLDLDIWNSSFGWDADRNEDGVLDGDANGDGLVTDLDFQWWQQQFSGETPPAGVAQIPEPPSLLIVYGLVLGSLFSRTEHFN
jgi:hypothetical protein